MRLALALILGLAAPALADPRFARDWPQTDFSGAIIDVSEVISGGPPKDGIPAIDAPRHIPVARETRMADREGVLSLTLNGETRA